MGLLARGSRPSPTGWRSGSASSSSTRARCTAPRRACLLANHGLIALGPDLDRARRTAVEVEELARQYLLAEQTGQLVLLNEAEMNDAIAMFATYGQQK